MIFSILSDINNFLWNHVVLWFLVAAGLIFSVYLRFVPIRFAAQSLRALFRSTKSHSAHISSFQALCTSLAQRVGTGNLAGVATALSFGGEGAIFWMWITALLGSSTAYAESTLAQVFKIRRADGSFFGGPAYYIHAGLRSKTLACIFSISLIIALGFVFNGVQSNTIAQGLLSGLGVPSSISGIFIACGAGIIIFGGRRRVSKIAALLVPSMALLYLLFTFWIVVSNLSDVFDIILRIVSSAFSGSAVVSGIAGHTVKEAFRYGVARGLFSNEAGWGSAPNAAASALVDHPSQQGLVQMLAVFIDTLIICSSTALIVLLAHDLPTDITGIALTQEAAVFHFGEAGKIFIAVAILLFGFTTILGNTFYGEANIQFMVQSPKIIFSYRMLVLITVFVGAQLEVPLIWQMADVMSATMAIINLISILLMIAIIKKTTDHFSTHYCRDTNTQFSFKAIGFVPKVDYDFAYKDSEKR